MLTFTVTTRRRSALLLAATALTASGALGGTALANAGSSDAADNRPTARVVAAPIAAAALPHAEARYAVVNANGTLARGSAGASSATTGLAGNYEALFDRDVRSCAYTASIGNPGAGVANPGVVTVQQRSGKPNGVFVTVKDLSGSRQAQPFHLVVTC